MIKFFSSNISFISQNFRSFRSEKQYINIDAIINIIEKHNISAYVIQVTWLDVDFEKNIKWIPPFPSWTKRTNL